MPRARRTRHSFMAIPLGKTEPERIDVLSYSPERARAILRERGWTNIQPWSARAVSPSAGWTLNAAALREAIDFLGIRHRVTVKQTGHRGGRQGCHQLRPGGDGGAYSHITIKSWLTPAQASQALWHELAHAMQAQRAIDANPQASPVAAWKKAYDSTNRGVAYWHKPIEVEARSYETHADELPLAR